MMRSWSSLSLYGVMGLLLLTVGCNDMKEQPKYDPLGPSAFFADGRASRPLVADTVSHGNPHLDEAFDTGKANGKFVDQFPFPVTKEVLLRGQQRFNIYCAVCHGPVGNGQGMIVKRGFPAPPSYHIDRLRKEPPGYFVNVITNGFGKMYSYGDRIEPKDRWAIAAYIRALQLSQHASLQDVPANHRSDLDKK